MSEANRVPVTILTGALGTGKTTLLNKLLKSGARVAVVENEYGDQVGLEKLVAFDGVERKALDDLFFELPNGCLCCAVKDDLVTTLEALVRRKESFDYLVIETSGVADPGPVATSMWLDDALEAEIKLDGVVCLLDCSTHSTKRVIDKTYEKQILSADRIVLTKSDVASVEQTERASAWAKKLNPLAVVYSHNDDASVLVEISSVSARATLESLEASQSAHKHSPHTTSSTAVTIKMKEFSTKKELERLLAELLWEESKPGSVSRIKGVATCGGQAYVVQGVFDVFELVRTSSEVTPSLINNLVVIGDDLDAPAWRTKLAA